MKKVLIISTSLRNGSNSEILALECLKGVKELNKDVEFISLKNKEIKYCLGCLACQTTSKCVINDDVKEIIEKVKNADAIVFATPIYYYGVSGQMKTLLDRLNPLYVADYKFRDIYMIATAAENEEHTFDKAYTCLKGWVDCFDKAELKGIVKGGGISDSKEANNNKNALLEAYNLGKNIA